MSLSVLESFTVVTFLDFIQPDGVMGQTCLQLFWRRKNIFKELKTIPVIPEIITYNLTVQGRSIYTIIWELFTHTHAHTHTHTLI